MTGAACPGEFLHPTFILRTTVLLLCIIITPDLDLQLTRISIQSRAPAFGDGIMGTGSHAAGESSGSPLIGHEDEPPGSSGAAPAAAQSSSSQSFEFVLVNDQGSRRQVRRHAMRQYMRQRRLDGIARLASSRAPMPGWLNAADSSFESMIQEDSENVDDARGSKECGNAIVPIRTAKNLSNSSSLISLISPGAGGRRDPFNSYPMPISEQDHRLINHCTYPNKRFLVFVSHLCRCGDVSGDDVQIVQPTTKKPNDGDIPGIRAERPPAFSSHAGDSLKTPGQCRGSVRVSAEFRAQDPYVAVDQQDYRRHER